MPDNALLKKLKLKPGQRAAILRAPAGFLDSLQPLPEGVKLGAELAGPLDWIQIFVKNQAELAELAPLLPPAMQPACMLWIAFPKGSSKIQTDLTRDQGWEPLKGADL